MVGHGGGRRRRSGHADGAGAATAWTPGGPRPQRWLGSVPRVDPRPDTHDAPTVEPTGRPTALEVPPWVQLVGLPIVLLFGWLFVRAASHAVVVFLVAGLISILLAPLVRSLARRGLPRILSVLVVFGAFAALVTVITIGAVDLLSAQATEMRANSQQVADETVQRIDDLQGFLDRRGANVDLRNQGVKLVDQLAERSTELSGNALQFGREFVTVVAHAAFNVVLVIVITIYMLLDAPRIGRLFARLLPADSGVEQLYGRMERSLLRYTVGQTLASLVMGLSATFGMWLLGVTGIWPAGEQYAVLFGLFVAVTEFAPSIGPVIGSIPPIITAAFDGLGPAIAVALLFLALHQIEGHIVIPKLMGAAIAVHPLLVIFGILAGAQIMGIGGILLALPLLAVGREIVQFIAERISFEPWPTTEPALAGAAGSETPPPPPETRSSSIGRTLQTAIASRRRRRRDAGDGPDGSKGTS